MEQGLIFFINSALLGIGLAMDAFSVSLANGLSEPRMRGRRMLLIAGVFAVFQALMPLTGWFFVHYMAQLFTAFSVFIPWIALALLVFIGSKMIWEGVSSCREGDEGEACRLEPLAFGALLVQGVATSIDALSVGFTIADYDVLSAILCAAIIAAVTLVICLGGIVIGKTFGTRLAGKASILGGVILIAIGLEIWITGVFF
ncbi:MAG: manganese efflux pump [Clostridia bacterium]|nr:manganese efflux pump [Clostridia bacterium]